MHWPLRRHGEISILQSVWPVRPSCYKCTQRTPMFVIVVQPVRSPSPSTKTTDETCGVKEKENKTPFATKGEKEL